MISDNPAADLAIKGLATARLTRLVTTDEITSEIRSTILDASLDENASDTLKQLAYLVTCDWCTSIWAGIAVQVMSQNRFGRLLVSSLALSQSSRILARISE